MGSSPTTVDWVIYMSLNKAIEHQKEYRKEYRGAKAIDPTCRNHGSCSFCERNRQIQAIKASQRTKEILQDYVKGDI